MLNDEQIWFHFNQNKLQDTIMPFPLLVPLAAAAAPTAAAIVTNAAGAVIGVTAPAAFAATTTSTVAALAIFTSEAVLVAKSLRWIFQINMPTEEIPGHQDSLRRQNEIILARQTEANSIAEQIQKSAADSAEKGRVLESEKIDAATLVLEASTKVVTATEALRDVNNVNTEAMETLHGALSLDVERHEAITLSAQSIPTKLEMLVKELDEKKLIIESLNSKVALLQTQVVEQETALQQVTNQVTGLLTLTSSQDEAINTLEGQKAELLESIREMAEELMSSSGPESNKENEPKTNRFFS